jgi:hypothetical protein
MMLAIPVYVKGVSVGIEGFFCRELQAPSQSSFCFGACNDPFFCNSTSKDAISLSSSIAART